MTIYLYHYFLFFAFVLTTSLQCESKNTPPPKKKISPSRLLWGKMTSKRLLNMRIKFYTSHKNFIPPKQSSGYAPDFQFGGFDLELWSWPSEKLTVTFGTDAKHLCQVSWKSDFWFSRNHNDRHERTNKRTNKHARSQHPLAGVIKE